MVERTTHQPESTPSAQRFFTISQVADELATSASQIMALLKSGELVGLQIGGRGQWRIERTKLEDYITEAYRRTADNIRHLPELMDDPDDSQA